MYPGPVVISGRSQQRLRAAELAGQTVTAVSPGWVDTPVWDQIASPEVRQARLAGMAVQLAGGRIGHPEDIANAVSYLMSDNLVTGTVLPAEGAQLLV